MLQKSSQNGYTVVSGTTPIHLIGTYENDSTFQVIELFRSITEKLKKESCSQFTRPTQAGDIATRTLTSDGCYELKIRFVGQNIHIELLCKEKLHGCLTVFKVLLKKRRENRGV